MLVGVSVCILVGASVGTLVGAGVGSGVRFGIGGGDGDHESVFHFITFGVGNSHISVSSDVL